MPDCETVPTAVPPVASVEVDLDRYRFSTFLFPTAGRPSVGMIVMFGD